MTDVTVAMNVFNGMPYLPEAVDSIRSQSLEDIEIIIVNDGSQDGTRDYLDSLTDPRIRVIHQANAGTAAASNVGLENCRTPYLARMDADDVALPNRLAVQLEHFKRHSEVGLVGTQAAWLGPSSVGKSIRLPMTHDAIWKALVDGRHAMVGASLMMKVDVARSVGGHWTAYRLYEDIDLMLKMGEVSRLANIDQTLYHYRVVQSSLNGTGLEKIRFYDRYAVELSRRRLAGMPMISPEEFAEIRSAIPWWSKMFEQFELHARSQYRLATEEIFGGQQVRGRTRLAWAALCSPRLTIGRLKRMMRRST